METEFLFLKRDSVAAWSDRKLARLIFQEKSCDSGQLQVHAHIPTSVILEKIAENHFLEVFKVPNFCCSSCLKVIQNETF